MSEYDDVWGGGFPLVEGRYETQDIRILPTVNREVEIVGTGPSSYYDTKAFLEAVILAVEFADEGIVAEVMAERAATKDAPVISSADVKLI